MKNRNIMRILIGVLTLVLLLTFAACNSDEPEATEAPTAAPTDAPTDTPTDDPSDPADPTDPAEDPTDPAEDPTDPADDPTDPAPHEHEFGDAVETKAPTCTEKGEATATCECGETQVTEIDALGHDYVDGKCSRCGEEDPSVHVHEYVDGECACGDVPVVPNSSAYDADGDGANDTFYFSPKLPASFVGDGVYHISAGDYNTELSKDVSTTEAGGISHFYVTENTDACIVYNIEVEQAGIYELGVHLRLKDTKERGTKYTINEGTIFAYSFSTSFKHDDASLELARNNADTVSSYMYGIYVNLTEGVNTIKIEHASECEKSQHYRDLYLYRLMDWTPVFGVPSIFDADGDGENDTYNFSATLPYEFVGNDTVHVWAGDYDRDRTPEGFKNTTNADGTGIDHWYIEENSGACLIYKVTVEEAGVYDMAIHIRLKDNKQRGTVYTVNEGTENEYSFCTSYEFASTEEAHMIRNPETSSAYMSGMKITLVAGDNYIKIEHAPECPKSQHYRDLYFVKAEA